MSSPSTSPDRGYTATKDQLLNRLKRIEGQVRGVQAMVDDDRYCIDVITQISAVQAALDKVALGLLDQHAAHCVMGAEGEDRDAKTAEQSLNRTAISATLHCLTGCAIGEVLGLVLATIFVWGNGLSIAVSILLAF